MLKRLTSLIVLLLAVAGGAVLWSTRAAASDGAQTPFLPPRGEASAPIVILLYSDFQCASCAQAEPTLKALRTEFPKDVQILFKHNPQPDHAQAPLAHEAAVEAARQGRFWEMHDLLFASQQALQRDDLIKHAATLGLDVPAFTRALDQRTHRAAVERDLAEARALGVTSAPAVFVNGRRAAGMPPVSTMTGLIRSLLNGGDGSEPAPPVPMTAFDLTGSPVRGPGDAPVTIVAYSDLQCSYCARANATVERLLTQYAGRVRWVFKHYPLDFHADAPLAHRAAAAAQQQGRFWEMHDAIFAKQRTMKREDLLQHAKTLGLDMTRFTADLENPTLAATIDRDMKEGQKLGIDGTPTFFVNGIPVVGALPYEQFAAVVDRALGGKTPPAKP